jgi:APA family basic amino acid/polyamine antiporter
VFIIVVFIAIGFSKGNVQQVNFNPGDWSWEKIVNVGFAVNLVWVSFAYSGWNASAYIAGEIIQPEKNLSRSILWGTMIVTVLYVFLNAVFMMTTPADKMVGVKEVGLVASEYIFGVNGGKIMGGIIIKYHKLHDYCRSPGNSAYVWKNIISKTSCSYR